MRKKSSHSSFLDLHDHAVARTQESGREDVLVELALSAAVLPWWTRWQPSVIHPALRAGADLTDIARAIGLDASEVIRRWRRWADVQTRLDISGVRPWTRRGADPGPPGPGRVVHSVNRPEARRPPRRFQRGHPVAVCQRADDRGDRRASGGRVRRRRVPGVDQPGHRLRGYPTRVAAVSAMIRPSVRWMMRSQASASRSS